MQSLKRIAVLGRRGFTELGGGGIITARGNTVLDQQIRTSDTACGPIRVQWTTFKM
jgi:hypothetical protein